MPAIPEQGSVGASGDLAPLAHLALVVIGEGHAFVASPVGRRCRGASRKPLSGRAALRRVHLKPYRLQAKEGCRSSTARRSAPPSWPTRWFAPGIWPRSPTSPAAMTLEATQEFAQAVRPAHPARSARIRGRSPSPPTSGGLLRGQRNLAVARRLRQSAGRLLAFAACRRFTAPARRARLHHRRRRARNERAPPTTRWSSPTPAKCSPAATSTPSRSPWRPTCSPPPSTDLSSISERRVENLVNPDLSGLPGFLTPHPGLNSRHDDRASSGGGAGVGEQDRSRTRRASIRFRPRPTAKITFRWPRPRRAKRGRS